VTPSKDQINLARSIVGGANKARKVLTDEEIRQRMTKLQKIQKGAGHPMYESLKIILLERGMGVQRK